MYLFADININSSPLFYVVIRQIATIMNTYILWSNSNTKDVLTSYAEGLACDNIDKKEYYNVHRTTEFCWYIINKEASKIQPNDDIAKQHQILSCSNCIT